MDLNLYDHGEWVHLYEKTFWSSSNQWLDPVQPKEPLYLSTVLPSSNQLGSL